MGHKKLSIIKNNTFYKVKILFVIQNNTFYDNSFNLDIEK